MRTWKDKLAVMLAPGKALDEIDRAHKQNSSLIQLLKETNDSQDNVIKDTMQTLYAVVENAGGEVRLRRDQIRPVSGATVIREWDTQSREIILSSLRR